MTYLMNRIASSVKATAQLSVLGSVLMAGSVMSLNVNAEDILTSTPVTYALATELTKGTDITTEYLPPKRYGIDRLPNWFGTKGASKVLQSGEKGDRCGNTVIDLASGSYLCIRKTRQYPFG